MSPDTYPLSAATPTSGGVLIRFDFIGRETTVKPLRIKAGRGREGIVSTDRICTLVAQYATRYVTMRGCRVVVSSDGDSLVIAGRIAEVARATIQPAATP